MTCELCDTDSGEILWRDDALRIVRVHDQDYPAFCRVIWNAHIKEITDLDPNQRDRLMRAVFAVENALRAIMKPDKINLASLGNITPHVHWHVIPRFVDDRHFPNPVWATPMRSASMNKNFDVNDFDKQMRSRLQHALYNLG